MVDNNKMIDQAKMKHKNESKVDNIINNDIINKIAEAVAMRIEQNRRIEIIADKVYSMLLEKETTNKNKDTKQAE